MKRLTAKFAASVTAPGKYGDGDAGLFLLVKPSGSKSYVQRLTIHGRRHDIGLGSAKWTTPSEARAMAQTNRKIARMGGDPCAGRRAAVPTFAEAANIVIALHAANWRDAGKSEKQWRGSLRDYALPRLGRKTVAEDHHGRRAGHVVADLERKAGNRPPRSPANFGDHGVVGRPRAPRR